MLLRFAVDLCSYIYVVTLPVVTIPAFVVVTRLLISLLFVVCYHVTIYVVYVTIHAFTFVDCYVVRLRRFVDLLIVVLFPIHYGTDLRYDDRSCAVDFCANDDDSTICSPFVAHCYTHIVPLVFAPFYVVVRFCSPVTVPLLPHDFGYSTFPFHVVTLFRRYTAHTTDSAPATHYIRFVLFYTDSHSHTPLPVRSLSDALSFHVVVICWCPHTHVCRVPRCDYHHHVLRR